jgi:hypothetical protein
MMISDKKKMSRKEGRAGAQSVVSVHGAKGAFEGVSPDADVHCLLACLLVCCHLLSADGAAKL